MTSPCAYSRSGLRRTCVRRSSRSISGPRPTVAVDDPEPARTFIQNGTAACARSAVRREFVAT